MQNPIQMMQQLKGFMDGYKGNPQEDAMKMIQQAGLNQNQLNQLQSQANNIYQMGKQMGLFK